MMDGGIALEREEFGHAHAAWRTDARQIVAHQIDNHQVLGAIFRAGRERHAKRRIVLGPQAARGASP
jgi:hypothetical protein